MPKEEMWELAESMECERSCTSFHVVVGTMEGPSAEVADRMSEELITELAEFNQLLAKAREHGLSQPWTYNSCASPVPT
jgi:hypothetical protein